MDIKKLIIDKYFNIYTRNGFEYLMEFVYDDCKIFLIDFNDIRNKNKELGYIRVNEIIKKTLSELKKHYMIGRAFSGDEIFFQTYNLEDDISLIMEICEKNNLLFTYIESTYSMGDNVQDFLEKMITEFH
jgi:hypothetical protein